MQLKEKIRTVEERPDGYPQMMWVLKGLTIGSLIDKFEYLNENYGLTQTRLGYSIDLGPSTISRIFSYRHTPNKATLHSLWLGLTQWEELFESELEEDE